MSSLARLVSYRICLWPIEKKLSEIGEVFGAAGGDAAIGYEIEEFAKDVVDVGVGAELAGDGFEFPGRFLPGRGVAAFAGVDQAEGSVGLGDGTCGTGDRSAKENRPEVGWDRRRFWCGTAWWNPFLEAPE